MVHDLSVSSTVAALGPQSMSVQQELGMSWDIEDVNQEGNAVIRQQIRTVKMKMTVPPIGTIEYDSEKAPVGPAAMLAPMYMALMKGAYVITMTPRGEIKDVKIPEEVLAALKNSPGAEALGEMATEEGFKKIMSQGSLVLQENAPKEGEELITKVEVESEDVGKQIVETIYKYQGSKDVDGVAHAVFQPTLKLNLEGGQAKVAQQESGGEILFNVKEGRLASSKLEQHVTIEQSGGQTKIDQSIGVTVKPAAQEPSEQSADKAETEATK
jgi:hypothetical protein